MTFRLWRWRLRIEVEAWYEPKRKPVPYTFPWEKVQELVAEEWAPSVSRLSSQEIAPEMKETVG